MESSRAEAEDPESSDRGGGGRRGQAPPGHGVGRHCRHASATGFWASHPPCGAEGKYRPSYTKSRI